MGRPVYKNSGTNLKHLPDRPETAFLIYHSTTFVNRREAGRRRLLLLSSHLLKSCYVVRSM